MSAAKTGRQLNALALEPRMMFDAAMVETAAQTVDQAQHQALPEQAESIGTDVAEALQAALVTSQTADQQSDGPADSAAEALGDATPATDYTVLRQADPNLNDGRLEVAFIDTSIQSWQDLRDSVKAGVEIVLLDGSKDGLAQIAAWAEGKSGYDAIHILSHGSGGALILGSLSLDADGALARSGDLAALGSALTADGDLLLYGCNVADSSGLALLAAIQDATGADVAASDDATGASTLGGDWALEYRAGTVESSALMQGDAAGFNDLLDPDTAPTLSGTGTDGNFVEMTPTGSQIFSAANVSAVDAGQNITQIVLTVENLADGADEIMGIDGQHVLMQNGSGTTTSSGIAYSVTVSGSTATVTLTKDATAAAWSGYITNLKYRNNSQDPSTATGRVFTITSITDAGTTSNTTTGSLITSTMSVTGINTAPTVSGVGPGVTFNEGDAAVLVYGANALTISPVEAGQSITSVTLTVNFVSNGASEILILDGSATEITLTDGTSGTTPAGTGHEIAYSVSVSGNTATVTLTKTMTGAEWASVLNDTLKYKNTSENPTVGTRGFMISSISDNGGTANGGADTASTGATANVSVMPVNDAPSAMTISRNSVSIYQSGTDVVVGALSVTDPDGYSTNYTIMSVNGQTSGATFDLFNISGGDLRAANPSTTATGDYQVVVYIADGAGGTYQQTLTISVNQDLLVTATAVDSASVAGTLISDMADGGGLDIREALYYANQLTDSGSGPITIRFDAALAGQTISLPAGLSVSDGVTLEFDGTGNNTLTIAGNPLGLGGTLTIKVGEGDQITLNANLTDSDVTSNLVKTGAGTLVLGGSNNSGGLNTIAVNEGTLSVAGDGNLGSDAVTLNGGTLAVTGSTTLDNAITLTANSTITNSANVTLAGAVSGDFDLTKSGSATLTLSNTNSHRSSIVTGGALSVASSDAVGSNGLVLNGGNLVSTGAQTFSKPISVQQDAMITTTNGIMTVSGVISGTGKITKAGGQGLVLQGTNTHTGNWQINAGSVTTTGGAAIGDGSAVVLNNSGSLVISASETIGGISGASGTSVVLSAGQTLTVAQSTDTEFGGAISGQGGLTKSGTGTLTLSGLNTYTGATTVSAGTLALSGGDALADASSVTVSAAGTLSVAASETIASLSGAGTVTISAATLTVGADGSSSTFSGIIQDGSSAGNLAKSGTGTLTLSGANTYTGTTTISAGTLVAAHDSALGGTAGGTTVSSGGALSIGAGRTIAENLALSGTGSFNSGALVQTSAGTSTLTGTVTLTNNATITTSTGTAVLVLDGVVGGGGALTKAGAGVLQLNGNNSYSGATTVSAGFLRAYHSNALGTTSAGTTISSGASLRIGDDVTLAENLSVSGLGSSNNGAIQFSGTTGTISGNITLTGDTRFSVLDGTLTLSGVISGAQNLEKEGAGTLTLSGTNTFSGATSVTAGTLLVTGALNGTTSVTVSGAATLGGTGSIFATSSSNTLSIASGGAINPGVPGVNNGIGTLTINGNLDLSGTLGADIAGATPGTQYDQITVNGTVTLQNTAALAVTTPSTPPANTHFSILDISGAGAVTGTFSGVAEGGTVTSSGNTFSVSYVGGTGNDVTLQSGSAPVVSGIGGSVDWAGAGNTVVLDAGADAAATDAELGALNGGLGNWAGASLTVQRQGTALAKDVFGFDTSVGGFTVSGFNLLSGGQIFATFTNTGGVLTISFTSTGTVATTALVNAVMRSVTYRNDTPYGSATIQFALSDGSSAATTASVTVASRTIYVDQTAYDTDGDMADGFNLAEALAVARDGDTIHLLNGTYRGQFIASHGGVTIEGQSAGGVILEAPDKANLVASAQAGLNGNARYAILDIRSTDTQTITVRNLTIDGRYQGPDAAAGTDLLGVAVYNTNAVIDGLTIRNIADALDSNNELPGISDNFGILAEAAAGTDRTVTIQNNAISEFQKTGIVAYGGGLTAIISGNTITMAGDRGNAVQNGMQISSLTGGRNGTRATITGNTITNSASPNDTYAATGIILYGAGTSTIENNTITGATAAPTAAGGRVAINVWSVEGVQTIRGNTLSNNDSAFQLSAAAQALTHVISGNTLNGNTYQVVSATQSLNPLTVTQASSGQAGNTSGLFQYYLTDGDDSFTDTGSVGSHIRGGAGADIIAAGSGNDTIQGGSGADTLTGGGGSDLIVGSVTELGNDMLMDFSSSDTLRITGAVIPVGQITLQADGTDTLLRIDSDNDTTVDLAIRLQGLASLTVADLVLTNDGTNTDIKLVARNTTTPTTPVEQTPPPPIPATPSVVVTPPVASDPTLTTQTTPPLVVAPPADGIVVTSSVQPLVVAGGASTVSDSSPTSFTSITIGGDAPGLTQTGLVQQSNDGGALFLQSRTVESGTTLGFDTGSGNSTLTLPPGTFITNDPSVQVNARLADGRPLPNWLQFDSRTGSFRVVGRPPANAATLEVEVVARGANGAAASVTFRLNASGAAPQAGDQGGTIDPTGPAGPGQGDTGQGAPGPGEPAATDVPGQQGQLDPDQPAGKAGVSSAIRAASAAALGDQAQAFLDNLAQLLGIDAAETGNVSDQLEKSRDAA